MKNALTPTKFAIQVEFEKKYITAHQIMVNLGISRTALFYAKTSGKLPEPIILNDGRLYIWLREEIDPILEEWKDSIAKRKGL
jgi:predicted DNA-binding transcriptional regulator AlpA